MKLFLSPTTKQAPDNNGIGRIVHAQFRLLPALGIQIIDDPSRADIIASHVRKGGLPRIDVLHCHGLYWADLNHANYAEWHMRANDEIIDASREAEVVTVPSEWVAMPFKRDMRISPIVIKHGIDFGQWKPGTNEGYVLWNKNRNTDVCDPTPAYELAKSGIYVHTTFVQAHAPERPKTIKIIGAMPFERMKIEVQRADVYLATTPETFGIGTLEAMAAGVPILGYDWCGTTDLVEHKKTGYLVKPGDIEGLKQGYAWIKEHRDELSKNAIEVASQYDWSLVMSKYVETYELALEKKSKRDGKTTVVITSYNYARFVKEAVQSALAQTELPEKIIVIDDGSRDDTSEMMQSFKNEPRVQYIRQENQGVAAARNNGIRMANTEFVTCLDADDRIAPEFVKTLSNALRRDKGLGIAYSGLSFIQPNGKASPYTAWPPDFSWEVQSATHNPPSNCIPSACMFRKEMWRRSGGYEQKYAPGEDAHFWTKGLSVGFKAVKASPDGLHEYRAHDGSASRTKKYMAINEWLPWMNDRAYPIGAPAKTYPIVNSYAMPDISVIVPVGPGHEKYLPIAIESLIGQTFRNWEVIVIDDTGKSELQNYIERYPFIIKEKTKGREGAGAARNLGMKRARGKTIFFLDADDYIAPIALDELVKEFGRSGGDNCYIYTDWYRAKDGEPLAPMNSPEFNDITPKFQHPVSVLIKRETALRFTFDEDLTSWEDWSYFIKARLAGVCGKRLPKNLLYYTVDKGTRAESLFSNNGKKLLEILKTRYKAYFDADRRNIMACGSCGGGGNEIIKAKERLGLVTRSQANSPGVLQIDEGKIATMTVRMEFIGTGAGTRTFNVNGTPYRSGNNSLYRYIVVKRTDVNKLLATGQFKLLDPLNEVIQSPATAPEPAKADVKKDETFGNVSENSFEAEVKAAKEKSEAQKVETPKPEYNKPVDAKPMPATVKELKAALADATMEDLLEWQTVEKRAEKPRKGYLTILDEEILNR